MVIFFNLKFSKSSVEKEQILVKNLAIGSGLLSTSFEFFAKIPNSLWGAIGRERGARQKV